MGWECSLLPPFSRHWLVDVRFTHIFPFGVWRDDPTKRAYLWQNCKKEETSLAPRDTIHSMNGVFYLTFSTRTLGGFYTSFLRVWVRLLFSILLGGVGAVAAKSFLQFFHVTREVL